MKKKLKKFFKTVIANIVFSAAVFVVSVIGILFFEMYIMDTLPWHTIPTRIAAGKYLKETYSEPMKVVYSGRYSAGAKTLNEPVIEFKVYTNSERTEFSDSYYDKLAIYYLKENLNEGLKDLYGDSCRAYIVTEGKNPFEEKNIELDQLKYNVEELKNITAGRMYICVEFIYDNSDEYDNAEKVLADDISAVNEYITNAGFKPKYIKYFAIISRDVKTLKSLLEIDYDESFKIKSYKGAMEDDEVIIKSLGDDIAAEEK